MQFRPCIDIHNGAVRQIVGGSLKDEGDQAITNFTSEYDARFYANLYRKDGIRGGHIILLNPSTSEYFDATKKQALEALRAYPQGASHVIVTSYVFRDGEVKWENLQKLKETVGKERIVLDLSCRKKEDFYYIVTNRWQTFTNVKVTISLLDQLSDYCDEFLIHGVDVEGKSSGVELPLVELLAKWDGIPITYAGGIGSLEDLEAFRCAGKEKLNFTIGSALDLFGGQIPYENVKKCDHLRKSL